MTSVSYLELLQKSLPSKKDTRYHIWLQYALDAVKRGQLIVTILSKYANIKNAKILDIGCGEGGISIALALEKGNVCSIDLDYDRVYRTKVRANEATANLDALVGNGLGLSFKNDCFDIVICNDVLEHVPDPTRLISEACRVVKLGGQIFISTPNRVSPVQIIHDLHYNLFGLVLLPRVLAKWYVTKVRKVAEFYNVYKLPTYWYLKRLFKDSNLASTPCFETYYYNQKLSGLQKTIIKSKRFRPITSRLLIPTFIFVCKKTRNAKK